MKMHDEYPTVKYCISWFKIVIMQIYFEKNVILCVNLRSRIYKRMTIEELNNASKNTMMEHLGMEFITWENNELTMKMPVDKRTMQPMGILHGGAVVALAETAGGAGSILLLSNDKTKTSVGMDIKANHIGMTTKGDVIAKATIRHKGNKTHVWDVEVTNSENEIISLCRVTNMIIEKK